MFNSVPCFQYSGWSHFNDENDFNTDFPELVLKPSDIFRRLDSCPVH